MSSYNIRPHHGLCLHFFRGKGYSEEFVENMTQIQTTLRANPTVTLVAGTDSVCRTCPNRVGEQGCLSDDKVLGYDQAVLQLCGVQLGDTLPWNDFFQRVEEHILSKNLRQSVCGNCQWTELCHERGATHAISHLHPL